MLSDIFVKRCSVREYADRAVEREKVEVCLEAARLAPSACNSQEWNFVVVDDVGLKDELCEGIFSGVYKRNMFAKQAPVLVGVVSDKLKWAAKLGQIIRGTDFYLIDIGIACENFALQAAELGLGTCMLGWFNEKKAKKILGVPKNRRLDLFICLGYALNSAKSDHNRKPFDEIVSYNSFKK